MTCASSLKAEIIATIKQQILLINSYKVKLIRIGLVTKERFSYSVYYGLNDAVFGSASETCNTSFII